jgi:hypothetical protein
MAADHLNVEAKRVDVRDDDGHHREGQNSLDEFAEVSDTGTVALKDLTRQSSNSTGVIRSCKGIAAIDSGHEGSAKQFDQEL